MIDGDMYKTMIAVAFICGFGICACIVGLVLLVKWWFY